MKWIFKGILIGLCVVAFMFAFGWVVMWLWNMLIPAIFAGPVVTYWQAVGLLVLARLLVGRGWSGGGGWGHHKKQYWKKRWREKLDNMSPEEREKFLANMKGRCGWHFRGEFGDKKDDENNNC
ncbi:MAG: hypothetical protein FD123_3867 [Bacteroidetes bacterium]|nr:MAG: hypothetical protein FD123_3867 [Bacteroidota bacterium]